MNNSRLLLNIHMSNPCFAKSNSLLFLWEFLQKWRKYGAVGENSGYKISKIP